MHKQDTLLKMHAGEGGETPQHNVATSALCSKRPQQITRTSRIIKSPTVHFVSLQGQIRGTDFLFIFLIFNRLYDIGEEQRHCCSRAPSVFATYDTVNSLHDKAHS